MPALCSSLSACPALLAAPLTRPLQARATFPIPLAAPTSASQRQVAVRPASIPTVRPTCSRSRSRRAITATRSPRRSLPAICSRSPVSRRILWEGGAEDRFLLEGGAAEEAVALDLSAAEVLFSRRALLQRARRRLLRRLFSRCATAAAAVASFPPPPH